MLKFMGKKKFTILYLKSFLIWTYVHAQLCSGAWGPEVGLSLYQHPYCVCVKVAKMLLWHNQQ